MDRRSILGLASLALVLVAIQLIARQAGKEFYLTQLTMAGYYTLVLLGLSLLMGYAGQISLGHSAFFAIGGYTAAVMTTKPVAATATAGWPALLARGGVLAPRADLYGNQFYTFSSGAALVVAIGVAVLVALLVGWPALRLKGHYLAMATLGFGLIVYRILLGCEWLGGADGLQGVPAWQILPHVTLCGKRTFRVENYYIAWTLVLLALAMLLNLVNSRPGRALRAIHDSELTANAMGVNTAAYKLKVFVISAVMAAVAGFFLTHYTGGIAPSESSAMKSIRYVALVAAGGSASLWGVLTVGTIINYLSLRGFFGSYDHMVFGALLVLIITLAPAGPLPLLAKVFRLRRRRAPVAAAAPVVAA